MKYDKIFAESGSAKIKSNGEFKMKLEAPTANIGLLQWLSSGFI
jgi:hypothetical protein